jgi:hypothetical protein
MGYIEPITPDLHVCSSQTSGKALGFNLNKNFLPNQNCGTQITTEDSNQFVLPFLGKCAKIKELEMRSSLLNVNGRNERKWVTVHIDKENCG